MRLSPAEGSEELAGGHKQASFPEKKQISAGCQNVATELPSHHH